MFPQLIQVGNVTVYSYGAFLWIGTVLGLFVSKRLSKSLIDPKAFSKVAALIGIAGIAGAHLIPVSIAVISGVPVTLDGLWRAGGVQPAILSAGLVGYLYSRKLGFPPLRLMDIFTPGATITIAVIRLGCCAAGCCFGVPSKGPWSITFTNPLASQLSGTPLGVPLVPTQLIDSLTQFLTFFFLIFVLSKKKFDGQVVALFLIAFGTGRGILEYVRGDRGLGVAFPGPFDLNQYASLGLAAIGLGIVAIQLVSGILRGKSFVPAGPVIPWSERRK